jgi:hypothetical protein
MRKAMINLVYGLIVMILITYSFGLFDDAFHKTGTWYKDIIGSIKYYIYWVLPYWWVLILIGTVVLALIFYGVRIGIEKFSR